MTIKLIEDLIQPPITVELITELESELLPHNIFIVDNPQTNFRPIKNIALFTEDYQPAIRTRVADIAEEHGLRVSKTKRMRENENNILYAANNYPYETKKTHINYTYYGETELRKELTTLWFMDQFSLNKYESWLPKR